MPRVVHFEIHAGDVQGAIAFYRAVFAWDFPDCGHGGYYGVITGAEGEPGINGGLIARQSPPPSGEDAVTSFVCTVDVPDLDAYVARVTATGGSGAMAKTAVAGVGWLAYCKDTEGNTFGMLQSDPNAA